MRRWFDLDRQIGKSKLIATSKVNTKEVYVGVVTDEIELVAQFAR